MSKQRLDQALVARGLVATRSQAESWVRLGKVRVNGHAATKPGQMVQPDDVLVLKATEQYVSRAGLKLASVAQILHLDFRDAVVLDVGSSTGGFTDYALQHGARKVIAVDVGTSQLHPSLHGHPKIELHEQTDIRDLSLDLREPTSSAADSTEAQPEGESFETSKLKSSPTARERSAALLVGGSTKRTTTPRLSGIPTIIVIDVSFISLREILPAVANLSGPNTKIAAMVKPQFEAVAANLKHKGVIKNDRMRRDILKDFETWARQYFVIQDKADSEVAGSKGNLERFYLLQKNYHNATV